MKLGIKTSGQKQPAGMKRAEDGSLVPSNYWDKGLKLPDGSRVPGSFRKGK